MWNQNSEPAVKFTANAQDEASFTNEQLGTDFDGNHFNHTSNKSRIKWETFMRFLPFVLTFVASVVFSTLICVILINYHKSSIITTNCSECNSPSNPSIDSTTIIAKPTANIAAHEQEEKEIVPCGDWEPFNDSQCYKILDHAHTHTYEDAEAMCQQNGSKLLQIRYQIEQDFISNYLFTKNKAVDASWLGAKYTTDENKFKWADGTDLTFANWQTGYPKSNGTMESCVQLNPESHHLGQWMDVHCARRALVVCQKKQIWSVALMEKIVLSLKQNPVPIGFIYVQLPKEPTPAMIWPWIMWTDVTVSYEGLFFRAGGGNAASFGTIQEDASPRLSEMKYHIGGWDSDKTVDITPGAWSGRLKMGGNIHNADAISAFMTDIEVRPRNMAIKIWKRIA